MTIKSIQIIPPQYNSQKLGLNSLDSKCQCGCVHLKNTVIPTRAEGSNRFSPQSNPGWPLRRFPSLFHTDIHSETHSQNHANLADMCHRKQWCQQIRLWPPHTFSIHPNALSSLAPSLYTSCWYDLWFTSSARLRNVAHAFRCVIGVGGDLIKITVTQIPLKLRIYSRQWSSHPRMGEVPILCHSERPQRLSVSPWRLQ